MLTALYKTFTENKASVALGVAFTSTLYGVGALYGHIADMHTSMGHASAATGTLLGEALQTGNSTMLELAVEAVISESKRMVEHCAGATSDNKTDEALAYSFAAILTVAALTYTGYKTYTNYKESKQKYLSI